MSETKHTVAPWSVIPQSVGGPIIGRHYDTGNEINPRGIRLICHVLQRGKSIQEDDANAALLSAAPELLNSLKEIINYKGGADSPLSDEYVMERAALAIAKAEGAI